MLPKMIRKSCPRFRIILIIVNNGVTMLEILIKNTDLKTLTLKDSFETRIAITRIMLPENKGKLDEYIKFIEINKEV